MYTSAALASQSLIRYKKTHKNWKNIEAFSVSSVSLKGIFSRMNVNCKVRMLFYPPSNQTNYL